MLYAWGHVIVIVVELVLKFQKKSFLLQRKRIKTWLLRFRSVARALLFALPSQSRNAAIILHRHNTVYFMQK